MAIQTSLFSHELAHVRAQGHNVGDIDVGEDGRNYRWDGVRWSPEGGGAGGGGAGFNFDWTKARQDALTQLTPYYEQKLKEASGDVERAKRLIEEDYKLGVRVSGEDLALKEKRAGEDLMTDIQGFNLDATDETRNKTSELNNRGVFTGEINAPAGGEKPSAAPVSNYAQTWHMGPLQQRQDLRKLAIERAINRQKESAGIDTSRKQEEFGITRARGIEEQDVTFPRTQRDLEEEKRRRAFEVIAPMKHDEEYARYNALHNLG